MGGRIGTGKQGSLVGCGGASKWTLSLAKIQQPQWRTLHKPRVNDWSIQHIDSVAGA